LIHNELQEVIHNSII